jgi:tetratricopeptide (TPR) repeat protein
MPVEKTMEAHMAFKDEIEKEHIGPLADSGPAKIALSPKEEPMHLDPSHDKEISEKLIPGIEAFAKKPIGECTAIQKLEALVHVMRSQKFLGFDYILNQDGDPKTVEQVYAARGGDCDELSRMFVALAEKLGITDIKQFYVTFRKQGVEEEKGHAALFYVEGRVIYLDPTFNKSIVFGKVFSSAEEAIQDPAFQKMQEDARRQESGNGWAISEINIIRNSTGPEALYYYEKGAHAMKNKSWVGAIHYYNLAIEKGLESAGIYGSLGFAYHRIDKQEDAIPLLNKAIEIKKDDPRLYSILGYTHFSLKQYDKAVESFDKQIALNPKDSQAKYNLGISYHELGNAAMDSKEFGRALDLYTRAETILKEVPASFGSYKEAIHILENIKSEKKDAKDGLDGN